MSDKHRQNLSVLLLLLCAAALCFWGIDFGLPGLFHSDEQALVKRALRFGGGDLNPHFFYYPTLHMYVLFFVYGTLFVIGKIGGIYGSVADFAHSYIRDPSLIYLAGRSLSALPTVGSVYLVYRLGRRLFNHWTGIVAGVLFVSIPRVMTMSRVIKPDPMMVFFVLVFFSKCLDMVDDMQNDRLVRNSAVAGFLAGIATSFKYNAAGFFILLPLSLFVGCFYRLKNKKEISRQLCMRNFLLIPSVVGVLFFVAGFTVGTPCWIIDFATFKRHLFDVLSYTAAPDNQIVNDGMFPSAVPYFKEMILMGTSTGLIGAVCMTGCIYFGFMLLTVRRDFECKKEILLLVVGAALVYIICARQKIVGWWYLAPAFPLYCITGAAFVSGIFSYKNKIANLALGVLVIAGILDGIVVSARESYALSQKDVRLEAKEWIEKNIPPGSKILLDVYGPQILQSKKLIRRQYKLAQELGNPKKDYFRLQIEALPDEPSYEFWYIERSATAPSERVERSREVELFEKFDAANLSEIKKKGFQYIVLAFPSEDKTEEERMLDSRAKVIKEFVPEVWVRSHHFRVKIYSLM